MKKHRKKKENKSREEGENGRDVAKEGMRARKVARKRMERGRGKKRMEGSKRTGGRGMNTKRTSLFKSVRGSCLPNLSYNHLNSC